MKSPIVSLYPYTLSSNAIGVYILSDTEIQHIIDSFDQTVDTVVWRHGFEGFGFIALTNLVNIARRSTHKQVISCCTPPLKKNIELWKDIEKRYGWEDADIGIICTNNFFVAFRYVLTNLNLEQKFCAPRDYKHKFIFLNGTDKPERAEMLGMLSARDLLKNFVVSYNQPINGNRKHSEEATYGLSKITVPINLQGDEENWDPYELNETLQQNFLKSAIGVVSETNYPTSTLYDPKTQLAEICSIPFLEHSNFSDKTCKFIITKTPFILMSRPNALSELRELGYKTFHPYINESYDLEQNDRMRLLLIAKEIERLCNLKEKDFKHIVESCAEAVEHNFKQMQNETFVSICYNL